MCRRAVLGGEMDGVIEGVQGRSRSVRADDDVSVHRPRP